MLISSRLIYFLTIKCIRPDTGINQFPGDYMPGVPPVPIPNTAVKPRAADGSRTLGPARVGCCQVYDPNMLNACSGLLRTGSYETALLGTDVIAFTLVMILVKSITSNRFSVYEISSESKLRLKRRY